MKDYQKTLLLGILILIFLCVHYKPIEQFTNPTTTLPQINTRVADCKNPTFSKEVDNNIIKHCADINGIGHGCDETDISTEGSDAKLSAFSIFGSYIDGLNTQYVNACLQRPHASQTLSDWGLCERSTIDKIRGFGYKENNKLLDAIELACNFYSNSQTATNLQD